MRTTPEVSLTLALDRGRPVVDQLVDELRRLVGGGVLRPGDPLPSTRALGAHLGVARGSVVSAYEQLVAEGWFEAAAGRSTLVNPRLLDVHPWLAAGEPTAAAASPAPDRPARTVIDLRPGQPMTAGLVAARWRSAWRRAADQSLDEVLPPLGWPPLRRAVTEQLRLRGLLCGPDVVAVTSGVRDALSLVILATGVRSVGVEDPGYPSLRRVLARHGLEVVPLPADEHGLLTGSLPVPAPDMVIVTPSHQYPLGGSLPVDRRLGLLAWARAHDVLVVEDDYDSELRYTSAPLPALASLDTHQRVVLLGTFSKVMSPALATGYVVLPPRLVEVVAGLRADLGQPVGLVAQRALADFLDSGELRRHIGRMRLRYRRRRDEVLRVLGAVDGLHVRPMDGGLHCVVEHGLDGARVMDALARAGVVVSALSEYWAAPGHGGGLVLGYGGVGDEELSTALGMVARVLGPGGLDSADVDRNCA